MIFFTKNPNLRKKKNYKGRWLFQVGMWGGEGDRLARDRVSEFFN